MSTAFQETATTPKTTAHCVAVVIPCFRVRDQIWSVLEKIGPEISLIYCIDDCCPEGSGEMIARAAEEDPRIHLIRHESNQGVGGAVLSGYRRAVSDGADIVVKVDGDGQMSPLLIPRIIAPIVRGEADYVKGNRFYRLEGVRGMPLARIIGNAGLSFLTKLSTGYWSLFDPTNGFTAIHADAIRMIPLEKIRKCYFFESDMLFRLNTIRAVVREVPMDAHYGNEQSSLSITKTLFAFPVRHAANFAKRLFYNYFLRNFSLASVHLVLGILLLAFGGYVGVSQWILSHRSGVPASAGTVMLAGLPVLVSLQLILNFIGFDMASEPTHPIQNRAAE